MGGLLCKEKHQIKHQLGNLHIWGIPKLGLCSLCVFYSEGTNVGYKSHPSEIYTCDLKNHILF